MRFLTRPVQACSLLAILFTICTMTILLHDDSRVFAIETFNSAVNRWRSPSNMHDTLKGSLAPEIYNLFQQVYSDRTPPPFPLKYIQAACAQSVHKPDLYLQCELGVGGYTTLMSQVKACLNIAFWMGANIVIPTTPLRNSDNLAKFDEAHLPLGTWMDRDFLIERIQKACPRIQFALLDKAKKPNIEVAKSVYINPCDPGSANNPAFCSVYGPFGADDDEKPWKAHVEGLLKHALDSRSSEEQGNLVVRMPASGLFFNRTANYDYQFQFLEELHLLRAIPQVREIVAELIAAMSSSPDQLDVYYGIHFRAEADAVGEEKNGWKTAKEQLDRVFKYADAARIVSGQEQEQKLIYLACGEQEKVQMFREAAETLGWHVADKWSIAESVGPELTRKIDSLDFDHMAIIDLAMLLVSDWFFGTAESAFSYTIAHNRNRLGRFNGNVLEFDSQQVQDRPDAVLARTHLFDVIVEECPYQCCL